MPIPSPTALDIAGLATAVVLVIGAIAAAASRIIAALGRMRVDVLAETAKTRQVVESTHDLVNGHATAQEQKLAAVEQQVQTLLQQLATAQEQRVAEAKARPAS